LKKSRKEVDEEVREQARQLRKKIVKEEEVGNYAVQFIGRKDGFIDVKNNRGEQFGVIGYHNKFKCFVFQDTANHVYGAGFLELVSKKLRKMSEDKVDGPGDR